LEGSGRSVRHPGSLLFVVLAFQYQLSGFRSVLVNKQFYDFLAPKACCIQEGNNSRNEAM
jgi:hypothetical protein